MSAYRESDQDGEACPRPKDIGASGEALARLERQDVRSLLEDAIASEIVPRLVLLDRGSFAAASGTTPLRHEVEELAKFVLGKDERGAAAHLEALAKRYSFATLFTQLVAPAAHHLGELWDQDYCDFFDVTAGIGRLQAFMS